MPASDYSIRQKARSIENSNTLGPRYFVLLGKQFGRAPELCQYIVMQETSWLSLGRLLVVSSRGLLVVSWMLHSGVSKVLLRGEVCIRFPYLTAKPQTPRLSPLLAFVWVLEIPPTKLLGRSWPRRRSLGASKVSGTGSTKSIATKTRGLHRLQAGMPRWPMRSLWSSLRHEKSTEDTHHTASCRLGSTSLKIGWNRVETNLRVLSTAP